MGQIRVMPEALANQIAAGEVVERPASCVKELIENSLDAGAKHILVEFEEGGIQSIIVQDDGHGMDGEDVVLAFERHATSKLQSARDLFAIATLGFRGEALASIAAVAKVSLASRTAYADEGIQMDVAGTDERVGPVSIGMPPGTRVTVRELFFNTPARLKYLRSVNTEQARCLDVVQRAALARPDVAFTCRVQGTVVFRTDGRGDGRTVLAALYGVGEARQFLPISGESADYRVVGWVGRPVQSRSNRTHGHLFINGRPIRNVAIHQSVVAAYGGRLMVNRHPMYAIGIEMDPKLVDVNIHPHKAEVRFSEERDVTALVERAVRHALDQAFLVSDVDAGRGPGLNRPAAQSGGAPVTMGRQPSSSFVGEAKPLFEVARTAMRGPAIGSAQRSVPSADAIRSVLAPTEHQPVPGTEPLGDRHDAASPGGERRAVEADVVPRPSEWRLRPVGQALGMYVIADDGANLYIIDQHAAHEKILYERFHAQLRESRMGRLPLLTPVVVNLSAAERTQVSDVLGSLDDLGLEIDAFGGSDLLVRSVPSIWEGLDTARLATDLVTELASGATPDVRASLREKIVMRACKAAIKANHRLSLIKMEALCDALSGLADPFHCPHGRPIVIRMTDRDLEKGFKRIV